ncbi:hypothetical protein [Streptomyces sp. NBC_00448]|uniref:hypothetical protein n=1 Tax=Streptomyces sp. NBC_00448 TaxID=2903652 RepID=UPI002E216985
MPTRRTALRWLRRAVIGGTALTVLAMLGAGGALRAQYAGDPSAAGRTRGNDAVWLGHAWVDGTRTPAELALLRDRVRGSGIRDLYVHTGPLSADGSLDPALYPTAAAFLADVRRELPGVRVQAWLGDTVAHGGTPGLRLDDSAVRARIRGSARQVLDAGFAGVHLDLEPVPSGDGGFLRTLDTVRALTVARGVPLSAAVPQIDPLPGLHAVSHLPFSHPKWWSQRYFGQVARRVDQIALMAYDTALPASSLFGGYIAQQTSLALQVTPKATNLLIGLPGYHTENFGHHGYAETVPAAVRGARVALARTDRDRAAFGLALYVDFAADPADWAAYRAGWGTP